MKASEIRKMNDADLDKELSNLKTELFNLRFQLATGQLDNSTSINGVKKNIARVKTVKRERELGITREA